MNEKYIQVLSMVVVAFSFVFIVFLYVSEPRTLREVARKGQVVVGAYEIDKMEFDRGFADFRRDAFPDARAAFDRADPEGRDAVTQFYVAYSYYRQGWGRLSNDDALFRAGVTSVYRVIALNPTFTATDETLAIKTPSELKNEFDEGLKITPSDFNPMRLTRERK